MLNLFFKVVDGLSWIASRLAELSVVILIVAMVYEVVARYIFNAPTEWAFDIAYMSSGIMFLLGVAWVLREDAHIRIDIVRNKMPERVKNIIEGVTYLLVLCPIFAALSQVALHRAMRAWTTNEVEMVSPWAPHMWPFYWALAIGLVVFTLQFAAEGLRAFAGQRTGSKGAQA